MHHLGLHFFRGRTMRATSYLPGITFIAVLMAGASASDAAVISRDWKTSGDELLTYDDVNRREWLDLTETQLFKFPGGTLQERYEAVLTQTSSTGIFAGFRPALQDDVYALAESAGIDTTTLDFSTNSDSAATAASLLGNATSASPNLSASGYCIDHPIPSSLAFVYVLNARDHRIAGVQAGNFATEYNGVWLYRAVPEPSAYALISLAIILLVSMRYSARLATA